MGTCRRTWKHPLKSDLTCGVPVLALLRVLRSCSFSPDFSTELLLKIINVVSGFFPPWTSPIHRSKSKNSCYISAESCIPFSIKQIYNFNCDCRSELTFNYHQRKEIQQSNPKCTNFPLLTTFPNSRPQNPILHTFFTQSSMYIHILNIKTPGLSPLPPPHPPPSPIIHQPPIPVTVPSRP